MRARQGGTGNKGGGGWSRRCTHGLQVVTQARRLLGLGLKAKLAQQAGGGVVPRQVFPRTAFRNAAFLHRSAVHKLYPQREHRDALDNHPLSRGGGATYMRGEILLHLFHAPRFGAAAVDDCQLTGAGVGTDRLHNLHFWKQKNENGKLFCGMDAGACVVVQRWLALWLVFSGRSGG